MSFPVPNHVRPIYDAETIHNHVAELGSRLEIDYPDGSPVLLSVLGGSIVFLADLLRAIQRPTRYATVQVLFSEDTDDVVQINFPVEIDVEGTDLLVVKDVITTGVIENYLKSQLLSMGARRVRFVALIDLPEERRSDFKVDYRLFSPRRPGVFVGYGLKSEGEYGNLPYLARIDEPNGISAPASGLEPE